MSFTLSANTVVFYDGNNTAISNAVKILERDIIKSFHTSGETVNEIILCEKEDMTDESYIVEVDRKITVFAGTQATASIPRLSVAS